MAKVDKSETIHEKVQVSEPSIGGHWVGVRYVFFCVPPPILGHGARASVGSRSTVSEQPGDIRIEYSESRNLFRVTSVSKARTQYLPSSNVAVFELEDVN